MQFSTVFLHLGELTTYIHAVRFNIGIKVMTDTQE